MRKRGSHNLQGLIFIIVCVMIAALIYTLLRVQSTMPSPVVANTSVGGPSGSELAITPKPSPTDAPVTLVDTYQPDVEATENSENEYANACVGYWLADDGQSAVLVSLDDGNVGTASIWRKVDTLPKPIDEVASIIGNAVESTNLDMTCNYGKASDDKLGSLHSISWRELEDSTNTWYSAK